MKMINLSGVEVMIDEKLVSLYEARGFKLVKPEKRKGRPRKADKK